jgi:ParB-like chromosome segregation protein Spo0J
VAIMLALAHKIQQAIDRGQVRDRAEVAQRLGLTRARVTQLLDLTLLAPKIQEDLLFAQATDGIEPLNERQFRAVTKSDYWTAQRESLPI